MTFILINSKSLLVYPAVSYCDRHVIYINSNSFPISYSCCDKFKTRFKKSVTTNNLEKSQRSYQWIPLELSCTGIFIIKIIIIIIIILFLWNKWSICNVQGKWSIFCNTLHSVHLSCILLFFSLRKKVFQFERKQISLSIRKWAFWGTLLTKNFFF